MIVITSDNKTLYICRAPGCGIPFTNQAGRRNHETKKHTDICESFKGQTGEVMHFLNTSLRDKGKKKIRAALKKANGATDPTPKKTPVKKAPVPEENPPAAEENPPAPAEKPPAPAEKPPVPAEKPPVPEEKPPAAAAPPATPAKPDNSHHNPNPKKKKGFWNQASDWWEGKSSEGQ